MNVALLDQNSQRLIRLVVRRALEGIEKLPSANQADLLEGAALLLEGDDASEASSLAVAIRRNDDRQAEFLETLFSK